MDIHSLFISFLSGFFFLVLIFSPSSAGIHPSLNLFTSLWITYSFTYSTWMVFPMDPKVNDRRPKNHSCTKKQTSGRLKVNAQEKKGIGSTLGHWAWRRQRVVLMFFRNPKGAKDHASCVSYFLKRNTNVLKIKLMFYLHFYVLSQS